MWIRVNHRRKGYLWVMFYMHYYLPYFLRKDQGQKRLLEKNPRKDEA